MKKNFESITSPITSKIYGVGGPIALAPIPLRPHFNPPPAGGPITTVNGVLGIVVGVIDLAQVVFWILAAGCGLYGAYLYLFSAGSKESTSKARNMMVYTVIAAILALLAYGLPSVIYNFLGTSIATPTS